MLNKSLGSSFVKNKNKKKQEQPKKSAKKKSKIFGFFGKKEKK